MDSLASSNEVTLVGSWMASECHLASGNTRHLWNFGMLSPAFQMSIEGSRDKDSVSHKWPVTNSIMSMMLSIHNRHRTNESQGDLGWITL